VYPHDYGTPHIFYHFPPYIVPSSPPVSFPCLRGIQFDPEEVFPPEENARPLSVGRSERTGNPFFFGGLQRSKVVYHLYMNISSVYEYIIYIWSIINMIYIMILYGWYVWYVWYVLICMVRMMRVYIYILPQSSHRPWHELGIGRLVSCQSWLLSQGLC
jgi:hypothetical protein